MSVAVETVAIRYLNVATGVPIVVNMPAFQQEDVYVIYGSAGLEAVYNTDYTLTLAGDFNTFTVVPLAPLLAKINALIAADPTTEINYITVRRQLDYTTSATPSLSRSPNFISGEFDRIAMRLMQLAETARRIVTLPWSHVGNEPVTLYPGLVGQFVTFDADGNLVPSNGPGFIYRGTWLVGTGYIVNDVVERGGSSWIARAPSVGVTPGDPGSEATWGLFAQGGGVADGTVTDIKVAVGAAIQSSKVSYLAAAADAVARPVNAKLFDWINPMDFGAVGNDIADDTVACNRAITAAIARGPGGVVVFTHKHRISGQGVAVDGLKNALFVPFSGYTVDDRLTLLGMGGRLTVTTEDTIAIRVCDPGTTIDGLHIDGGRNYGAGLLNTWGIGLIPADLDDPVTIVSQSFCKVVNCHITQVYEGVVLRPGADGSGSYYPIITENHFNWCSRGMQITTSRSEPGNNTRGTRGVISNNRVERGVIGIDVDYATEFLLIGNYFQFMWATFEAGLGHQRQAAVECAMRIGTHSRNILIVGGEAEQCTVDVQNDASILGAPTAITFTAPLVAAKVANLTAPWAGATDSYTITFSNGEERIATLTNGNAAVSWHMPVTATAAATAAARGVCPGGVTMRDFPLGGIFAGVSTNFNPVLDPRTLRLTRRSDAFEQLQVVFGFTGAARIYSDSDSTGKRDVKFATNNVDRLEMFSGKTTHFGSAGNIELLNTGSSINGTAPTGVTLTTTGTNVTLSAGGKSVLVNSFGMQPGVDNANNLGDATHRWTQLFAMTATISTSDGRFKDWQGGLNDREIAVGRRIADMIGTYRWLDAVQIKGDGARKHTGVIVQDVIAAFEAEGLNAFDYGAVCYNSWENVYEPEMTLVDVMVDEYEDVIVDSDTFFTEEVTDTKQDDGSFKAVRTGRLIPKKTMVQRPTGRKIPNGEQVEAPTGDSVLVREAGDLYGLRYEELWAFVIAANNARMNNLEARLAAMEQK